MKIHALASLPNYAEHVEAIFKHLPEELQGERRYGARNTAKGWAETDDIVMVGGFYDVDRVQHNRIIYVEHGAGQSYRGDPRSREHPAYHGTPHHPERVIAYISPRQEVADSWHKPAFAAGAPVCDDVYRPGFYEIQPPVAAITFHWNASRVCPEAGSALEHYAGHLGAMWEHLENQGFVVVAHHHPRDLRLAMMWKHVRTRGGACEIASVHDVRKYASLLVCDNSSLMYEMAYLGRDVIALNCPEYRRDVHHGLRFWEWQGLQIDSAEEFMKLQIPKIPSSSMAENAFRAYDQRWSHGNDGELAADWLTSFVQTL